MQCAQNRTEQLVLIDIFKCVSELCLSSMYAVLEITGKVVRLDSLVLPDLAGKKANENKLTINLNLFFFFFLYCDLHLPTLLSL